MRPDRWIVIEINNGEGSIYKVLCQTYGGYGRGDSWRLNSGIKEVSRNNDEILFHGYSGSTYYCNERDYGTGGLSAAILCNIRNAAKLEGVTIETLDKNTDWMKLDIK